jgi:hypothetical protein
MLAGRNTVAASAMASMYNLVSQGVCRELKYFETNAKSL